MIEYAPDNLDKSRLVRCANKVPHHKVGNFKRATVPSYPKRKLGRITTGMDRELSINDSPRIPLRQVYSRAHYSMLTPLIFFFNSACEKLTVV